MLVILAKQLAIGLLVAVGKHGMKAARDGNQRCRHIDRPPGEFRKGNDPIAQRFESAAGVDIDVHPQAHQVRRVNALAKQPGELAAADEEIVRPFELHCGTGNQRRGGVPNRKPRQQRQLMRGDVSVDRKNERDGQHTGG